MEHLFYQPDTRTFRSEVRFAGKYLKSGGWPTAPHDLGSCPPDLKLPWLGHDHYSSSYHHSDASEALQPEEVLLHYGYPDWDIDSAADSRDLHRAHASFDSTDHEAIVHRTTAFLQSWLYLGVLEAVCERPISHSYLVRQDGRGAAWLYSRNLPALLEAREKQLLALKGKARDNKIQQARVCVSTAAAIFSDLVSDLDIEASNVLFLDLRHAVATLEPALTSLYEAILGKIDFAAHVPIRSSENLYPNVSRSYSANLIAKGWCPFVISSAETAMGSSLLRYMDISGFSSQEEKHKSCVADSCNRNQVDTEDYAPQHRSSHCLCPFIKPNLKHVLEILDAGMFPVVRYDESEQRLEVGAVAPASQRGSYIAYSHVWADGLGSCTEQGLPACQIQRLHDIANSEGVSRAWFWIDGLCVPKREPYRGKAIQLMRKTYMNALGAVVLDNSLHCVSVSSPLLQLAWTVYASGWMGRLWTYQEGFIPPWVDLELSDGLLSLYELIQRLYKMYHKPDSNPFPFIFAQGLLAALQKARPLDRKYRSRSKSRKIVDAFNALSRRQTSRPDDQLLVLGLLLDIDMGKIMALRGEDRWKEFYLSLRDIPWTILFDQRPKMSLPNFAWAPKLWTSSGQDMWISYDEGLATCSEEGLHANLTVIMLHDDCVFDDPQLILQIDGDPHYSELSRSATGAEPYVFNIIFIRYFKDQHPRATLDTQRSVLTLVGLGLLDRSTHELEKYSFEPQWNFQLLLEPEEHRVVGQRLITGNWMDQSFTFT